MRQRVFLLGLPFLMDMFYSVFFDSLRPFWVPSSWEPADNMMFWLLVTWIIYFDLLLPRSRRSAGDRHLFGPRLSAPEEIVLAGFAAYMLLKVGTTAVRYMDLGTAIGEARIPLYVFVGYVLLRGILCHAGRKETLDFVAAIVVVNAIAAGFYVLHQGLRLYIYVGMVEYQYIVFNGEMLTRSFYFMPQYLPLAIAFCAAKRTWSRPLARGPCHHAGRRVGVVHACAGACRDRGDRGGPRPFVYLSSATPGQPPSGSCRSPWSMGVFVVAAVSPAAHPVCLPLLSYHGDPVRRERTRGPQPAASLHLVEDHERVARRRRSPLGRWLPSPAQDARVTEVGIMAADLVWVPTLWNLGLLGVAGLAAVFIAFAWRATSMSLGSGGDAAFLSTVLLGVIVGVFLLGFVEWTIFDPWHTPLALSFFALLTAERFRQRAEAQSNVDGHRYTSLALEFVGHC